MTNKEQFLQGEQAFHEGKYQEARRVLSRVTKDDEKIYAEAQLMLAETQLELRNERAALKYLKQVPDIDDEVIQSKSRTLFEKVNKKISGRKMIQAHHTKEKKDRTFADATEQLVQGVAKIEGGYREEGRRILENITKEFPELYAKAQFLLAGLSMETNDEDDAKTHLRNIEKEMQAELYIEAQTFLFSLTNDPEEKREYLNNIDFSLENEETERAKLIWGYYAMDEENFDEALKIFSTTKRKISAPLYAEAQAIMSDIYIDLEDYESAIQCLRKIKRSDHALIFAHACKNLAGCYAKFGDTEQVKKYLQKIRKKDSVELYKEAQAILELMRVKKLVAQGEEHIAVEGNIEDIEKVVSDSLERKILNAQKEGPEKLQEVLDEIDAINSK